MRGCVAPPHPGIYRVSPPGSIIFTFSGDIGSNTLLANIIMSYLLMAQLDIYVTFSFMSRCLCNTVEPP